MKKKIANLPRVPITKGAFKKMSPGAGIYVFWGNRHPVYIGKSVNLKARLLSYLETSLSPKTGRMLKEASAASVIKVTSELESLLLEAELIRNFQPKYNSAAKDDKHPLYINITADEFPQVTTARKNEIDDNSRVAYGPFPSSAKVYSVLRMLRKIFPFSDHKPGKKVCLYYEMGLCRPCPSEIINTSDTKERKILKKTYLTNILRINRILAGKATFVKKELVNEMKYFTKKERFEEAREAFKKIEKLDYITQPQTPVEGFLENPNLSDDIRDKEAKELKSILARVIPNIKHSRLSRIECYDVAHLSGSYPTASMVTFVNGEPEKKFYRHFKIGQAKGQDDLASMREVAKRRFSHLDDWGTPDLIIVDGGRTQVAVFWSEAINYRIPVIGLAKEFETLVIPKRMRDVLKFREVRLASSKALMLLQRIRNEAHRFARRLHHKLVTKSLLDSGR